MELVLATRNPDKAKEIRACLYDLGHKILTLNEFPEIPEVEEDGASYEENATKKAMAVSRATNRMALGDDTGLEVDALGGEPGLYSARYAGEGVSYADNRRKLLSAMKDVPVGRRSAHFRCAMALAFPSGQSRVVEGIIEGEITVEERGQEGFGYDPIFFLPEAGKTLAELSFFEKNQKSHRAKALQQMKEIIRNLGDGV